MRYISGWATSLVGATTGRPCGGFLVSGFWRIVLVITTAAAGAGIARLHAQTALTDPKDSRQIFATTCSACHKSPQGLAKSGQVAGFLRQHYTTGPEMSAAMAAYLVAAGSGPASKKGEKKEAAENAAAKSKSKKQEQAEQAALSHADAKERNLRGKQRHAKQAEEPPAHPAAADHPAPEPVRQAAAPAAAPAASVAAANPAQSAAPAVAPAEPLVTFDLPLPPMPEGPPADLTQSAFSSSPVP
jgi:hypothetical protein